MAIEITRPGQPQRRVLMQVISDFGFSLGGGRDVFPGETFECDETNARLFSEQGRAVEITPEQAKAAAKAKAEKAETDKPGPAGKEK